MRGDQPYKTPRRPGFLAGFPLVPISFGLAFFLLGLWISTEHFAIRFLLGGIVIPDAHVSLFDFPIYAPWKWPVWEIRYFGLIMRGNRSQISALVGTPCITILSAMLAPMLTQMIFKLKLRRLAADQSEIYGSSHWATARDREEAGLHDATAGGILIGAVKDEEAKTLTYLYDTSDRHVLVTAPTGTGKSTAVVIPAALTYPHSMVVLDLKEEVWDHTAGFRQKHLGHRCARWTPNRREGCTRINPLQFVRIGTHHEVGDCALIAEALVQSGKSGPDSEHWNQTATSLVTGMLLHECWRARKEGQSPSLRRVGRMLSPSGGTAVDVLEKIRTYEHDPACVHKWTDENGKPTKTHHRVVEKMAAALQRDPKEGMSVISTAEVPFNVFADPLVEYATSDSDFEISDLVDGDRPMSLYLCVPPTHMKRFSGVIRMVFLTIMNQLTEEQKKHKYELLFLLDEFAQLGYLTPMENALAYVRGYGMRFVLIVQNIGQINKIYTRDNSIIPNCHTIVAYTPSPTDTGGAKLLNEALGSFTVQHLSYNQSGMPTATAKGISTHVQNTKKDLMSIADLLFGLKLAKKRGRQVIAPGESIILVYGLWPIKGLQTFWFFDKRMRAWTAVKADLAVQQEPAA